jgi:putative ABC transport system permease protein
LTLSRRGVFFLLKLKGSRFMTEKPSALVLREGLLAVAAGLAVGLVTSFGASRVMSSLLDRVSTNDFATCMAVFATLIAVAALASYIPARRAMRVDPMVALRFG